MIISLRPLLPAVLRGRLRAGAASYQTCSCTGQGFPRRLSRGQILEPEGSCLRRRRGSSLTRRGARSRVSSYLTISTLPPSALRPPIQPCGLGRCIFCCTFPGLGREASFANWLFEKKLRRLFPVAVGDCPLPRLREGCSDFPLPRLTARKRSSSRPDRWIIAQISLFVNLPDQARQDRKIDCPAPPRPAGVIFRAISGLFPTYCLKLLLALI